MEYPVLGQVGANRCRTRGSIPMPIRVLIADDHALMRTGLRALLERTPEIRVVAEAADGREALALVARHRAGRRADGRDDGWPERPRRYGPRRPGAS